MQAFEELLKRLRETTKSFNGRMVGDNITRTCPDKVLAIDKAENPFIEKQVRSFFGLVLFLDIFYSIFSHIAASLTKVKRKVTYYRRHLIG